VDVEVIGASEIQVTDLGRVAPLSSGVERWKGIGWRWWEIYRAGRSAIGLSDSIFFRTMAAANKAGKAALKQLLTKLNT